MFIYKGTTAVLCLNSRVSVLSVKSFISSSKLQSVRFQSHNVGNFSFKLHRKPAAKILKNCMLLLSSLSGLYLYAKWKGSLICRDVPSHSTSISFIDQRYVGAIDQCRDIVQRIKDEVGAPGISVGVSVDGNIVWEEGIGYSDVENRVPCTKNTVYRIASISKSLTMAAIAKLWQDGKLDLDKPVQHYLPDFPQKTYNGESVTITSRQLVSHLGGIRHYKKNVNPQEETKKTSNSKDVKGQNSPEKKAENTKGPNEFELKEYYLKDKFPDVQSALKLFKDDPLVAKPGSAHHYTTHGFTLLSAIVEKAAQEEFTAHMKKLFKALGMTRTYLDVNDDIIYNRSRNYSKDKRGRLVNVPYVDNSYKWAGGGFLSTAADLLKFGNAMLYSLQYQPKKTPSVSEQNSVLVVKAPAEESNNKVKKAIGAVPKIQSSEKSDNDTCVTSCEQKSPGIKRTLPGYLSSSTVKTLWSSVTEIKSKDYRYGMGWAIIPVKQECEFCQSQEFAAFHTGGAIGASSVLLILPKDCNVKDSRHCEWSSPPKGIVVVILTNFQEVGLHLTALQVAEIFKKHCNSL